LTFIAAPEKPPWWDVAWSTLALAIIGLLGTCAAIGTLLIILRQTKAIESQVSEMRKTGEQTDKLIQEATVQSIAAKRSADALINSERAWVDGEIVPTEDIPNPSDYPDMAYELRITNQGRTPAQILSWELELKTYRQETKGAHPENLRDEKTTRNLYMLLSSEGVHITEERIGIGDYTKDVYATFKVTIYYLDLVTGSIRPHTTSFVYQAQNGHLERVSIYNEYK
jgi:hypothetical protein